MPGLADDSIIDVTGLFFKLQQALEKELGTSPPAAPAGAGPATSPTTTTTSRRASPNFTAKN